MLEHVFRTKPLAVILAEEDAGELHRELNLFDLLMLAMGATIGSGVFATTGDIISGMAGPAAVVSWIISGLVCVVNAFAFMELCTRVPSSGSTYAYSYHALGELPAVIAGWLLTLEYAMSGAGVARSWAIKMENWLSGGDPVHNTKYHWLNLEYANFLGALVQGLSAVVLLQGIRFGKYFVNIMTGVKLAVVAFIIIAGFAVFHSTNLDPFIPTRDDNAGKFGFQGVITGASMAFFGYVGFDEVCCLAAETKNPRKMMPKAVIGGVFLTMAFSALASFVLSGMTTYSNATDFSVGFNAQNLKWAAEIVHAGEIVTMPIVVLIGFLAQPRLQYALACDGLMPALFAKVDSKGVLYENTLYSGIFFTLVALVVPFVTLWDIVNFGVLLSLVMANASVVMVRTRKASPNTAPKALGALVLFSALAAYFYQIGYSNNGSTVSLVLAIISLVVAVGATLFIAIKCPQELNDPENYSAPLIPWLPLISILLDFYLMAQITYLSQLWSLLWILAAVISYFAYGYRHSEGRTGWVQRLQLAPRTSLRTGMLSNHEPSPGLPTSVQEKLEKA